MSNYFLSDFIGTQSVSLLDTLRQKVLESPVKKE